MFTGLASAAQAAEEYPKTSLVIFVAMLVLGGAFIIEGINSTEQHFNKMRVECGKIPNSLWLKNQRDCLIQSEFHTCVTNGVFINGKCWTRIRLGSK